MLHDARHAFSLSYRTLPAHIGEQMTAAVKSYHTMKALSMPAEYLHDLKTLNHELCVVRTCTCGQHMRAYHMQRGFINNSMIWHDMTTLVHHLT